MQPIKVCCFCESWESGGIESFLCNVLCRMDPEKVQIDLVCASQKRSIFTQPMKKHGIHFYELSGSQHNLFENYRQFIRILKERRYDVFHLNAFQGLSLYYLRLARRAGVPVRIAHSHNTALRSSLTRPLKLFIHNFAKGLFTKDATDFWACSLIAAKFLFPVKAANKFQWIPNGIETERFRFNAADREKIRHQLGVSDAYVIGNIGRLCNQKNQMFLLDVFYEVAKEDSRARLLLVGEGEQETELKRKAKHLNITDKIIFYGVSRYPERLLWAMDIFVFPSLFEGLGIAVIEAQAAGLSVICSECIPEEACITSVQKVSLSKSTMYWKNAILTRPSAAQRETAFLRVRNAGYETESVSQNIEKSYIRKLR